MAENEALIGLPTPLFSLQLPLDREHGRILGTPVCTASGSRKRKRSEIATTVDGGGINIHSVGNNRLVASYPVPPNTYFQSPPCSVCTKTTGSEPVVRHTYAATDSTPHTTGSPDRPQLLHFTEPCKQSTAAPPLYHKYDTRVDDGRVFALDVLPHVGGDTDGAGHDIVLVYENGTLACLDQDLEGERWRRQWTDIVGGRSEPGFKSTIEFAELLRIQQARKGLLSGRQDVLARLGVVAGVDEESPTSSMILVLLERRSEIGTGDITRLLHVFSVQQHSADGLSSRSPPVQHLVHWFLPSQQASGQSPADGPGRYSLDASAGTLHQLLGGVLTTFNFNGLLPQVDSILKDPTAPIRDFLSLAPTVVLTTSDTMYTIHDVKYNTIQASHSLDTVTSLSTGSKKRKRQSDVTSTSLALLTVMPSSGLVVGLHGTDVVSFRFGIESRHSRRRVAPRTLLVHALGKGIRSQEEADMTPASAEVARLPKFMRKSSRPIGSDVSLDWLQVEPLLNEAVAAGDIPAFEDLFASGVGILLPEGTSGRTANTAQTNGHRSNSRINGHPPSEGHDLEPIDEQQPSSMSKYSWPTDQLIAPLPHLIRRQAHYALGSIFKRTVPGTKDDQGNIRNLTIKFCPPNVFRWLVVNNFITVEMISQALSRRDSGSSGIQNVSPAEVSSAVAEADPSTQLLYTLLTESTYLDLPLLIRAIRVYVQSHEAHSSPQQSRKLITAPPKHPNADDMELDGDHTDIDELLSRADEDISRAESILDESFELRTIGLKHALIKLHAFSRTSVTQMLRKELSAHEIRFLIHILRIELQDGGWVSRYLDTAPSNLRALNESSGDEADLPSRNPNDSAVTIVSSLLSSCVDAIGIGGWLSGSTSHGSRSPSISALSDDLDPHELIKIMYNETFAVLEGLHEVNFINSAVMDFLHFAERLRLSENAPNLRRQNKKARAAGELTKPVTLYSGQEVWGDIASSLKAAMPVGGKLPEAERGIDTVKVSTGGQVKAKSRREIGMEKSKKVGKYSFERIRV